MLTTTFVRGTKMSKGDWRIPKTLPELQRKHLKKVLKHNPNARQYCVDGDFDKAANLLLMDDKLVASNWLRQMKSSAAA